MYGEIVKKKKNKIGLFVNVLGEDEVSYYGDSRGISKDVLMSLCVGDKVNFEGELSSTGNPTVKSLVVTEKIEKICLEFSEDEKERVKQLMSLFLSQEGSCFITKLNQFLLSNGFDYKKYGFHKLKGFFVEQFSDILNFETNDYNGVPQTVVSLLEPKDTSTLENNSMLLTQEIIESIEIRIQEIIDINGVFLCSLFPSFIKEFGIDDYHDYAKNVDSFVEKFLSNKFVAKRNVCIGDKNYPNVIVPITATNLQCIHQDDIVLDNLNDFYNASNWEGFLTSTAFVHSDTSALPMESIQMGLSCARKILDQDDTVDIKLSLFQKELITSRTTTDFFRKWKVKSNFKNKIVESYIETSMCNLSLDNDKTLIPKILNDLGRDTKPNTSFTSLISRFEAIKDKLIPYLYVIRLYGSKSAKAIEQCVAEYCYFMKNLNEFSTKKIQKRVHFEEQVENFKAFIKLAHLRMDEQPFSHSLSANIVSVFFDIKQSCDIRYLLETIDKSETYPEWKLVHFLESDSWEEHQISDLFIDVNLRLIAKSVAVVWEKYFKETSLPKEFLSILVWIIKYGNYTVLDEIIRVHYLSGYTKREKQLSLIGSLQTLTELLDTIDFAYNFICYIINYVFPDFSENDYPQISDFNDKWMNISSKYYNEHLNKCTPLTAETEEQFITLFSVFALDQDRTKEIQNIYANWYVNQVDWETCPAEQVTNTMHNTYSNGAFRAFQLAYESGLRERSELDNLHELYIDSLIKLGAYGKAIRSAFECESLNQAIREKYVVKAIGDNFSKFGFTSSGLLIFDEDFSVQEAIDILMHHFSTTDYSLILSLIILYAANDELIKSVYLFSIFHIRAEVGFSRIYAQFRSKYGRYFAKLHNHYCVIQEAFNGLSMPALLSFIKWASKITIPDYSDYLPTHVFSIFYDALIKDPDDISTWKKTFNHIISYKEKNSWLICVCGMIMMNKFEMPNSSIIRSSFLTVLEDVTNEKPGNLLDFLCQYIVENEDDALCSQLGQLLSDKNVKAQLLGNNPWSKNNTDIIDSFANFCLEKLQETGNMLYYDIITNIKEEITGKDLLKLSQYSNHSKSKSFLIRKLCQCYLENIGKDEARELLNSDLWHNSSYQEREIYGVLKLVYESNMILLTNYPKFFSDEEDVQRFKQDCIKIISVYPDSEAFLKFDKECFNLKHKLLLFSFTLGIFYNEDIYHTYWFDYSTLIEQDVYDVYLRYLEKCYEAQLVYNPSYIFEYKTWRYLKLLMIESFDSENVDDTQIIRLMKMNGHYERLISEGYNKFKQNIRELLLIKEIDENDKHQLLFGLISADFSSFLDLENSFLYKLTPKSSNLLKQILSALNYRDVNERFYQTFIPIIDKVNNQNIVALANTFSDSLALAFNEWFMSDLKEKEPELFVSLTIKANAVGKSGGNICVEKVLELDENLYNSNKTFVNAVVLSKQLPGKIFDRLRMSAIGQAKGVFNERFEELAVYLKNTGYPMAMSQYKYLIAIRYAMEKKHDELNAYLSKVGTSFLEEVPADWGVDSSGIIAFAESDGTDATFKLNSSFYYSESYLAEKKWFSFIDLVYQNYKDYREKRDIQTSKLTIEDIINNDIDIHERIFKGLNYFHSVGINDDNKNEAIEFGYLLVSKESTKISVNHKLSILDDLYNQRTYLSQIQKERIFECFSEIYREFSIDIWVDNYEKIINLLSLDAQDSEIDEVNALIKHILEKCPEFSKPPLSRATELQYEQLNKIVFIGSSAYVSAIKAAASRRIRQIEGSARITSCIENINDLLQDGCVYFQLRNNGYITVDLKENCEILLTATLPNNQKSKYEVLASNIYQLRSGWITGCRQDISNLCENCNIGDNIEIKIEIKINDKLITRSITSLKVAEPILPTSRPRPYDVKYAAGEDDKNKIYGREEEQEDIAYAIESGKAVIYGPSRIGKTSLLNWVRHNLATEHGNVITVLFGEGKESDYTEYFYDNNHRKIQYDNENRTEINCALSEYLLIDILKYGLIDNEYGRANFDSDIMKNQNLINELINILSKEDETITYRYKQVNSILKSHNSELWIIFDEFQQIVERWKSIYDDEPIEFIRLCEKINKKNFSNIKLIFCGSDELLRQMVLIKENSIWRQKILDTAGQVQIGSIKEPSSNIEEDPFKKMITDDDSVVKPGIIYSDKALTAICVYSGRVPMYGKEICNTVLENISSTGIEKFGRNVIYSYDVAKATQMLATQMLSDIRKGDSTLGIRNEFNASRIANIFDAVTKGLNHDTDKQYLWFIANWFINNPTMDKFPYSEFEESSTRRLVYGKTALEDSLLIAKERGIISGDERSGYVFSTVFYYNAFCGTVYNLDKDKIFVHTKENMLSNDEEHQLDKFDSFIDQMTLDEKKKKHKDLYWKISEEDEDYPDFLRKVINGNTGNTYIGGDYIHGDKKTQMNLQITAQTINSFSTLLTGDCSSTEFAKAFADIPGIKSYLGNAHEKVLALQNDIDSYLDEDGEIKHDTMEEYESRAQLVEKNMRK